MLPFVVFAAGLDCTVLAVLDLKMYTVKIGVLVWHLGVKLWGHCQLVVCQKKKESHGDAYGVL